MKAAMGSLVGPNNPIAELIDLFGYELTLKFLFSFGGQVIHVPKLSQITEMLPTAQAALDVDEKVMPMQAAVQHYSVRVRDVQAALEMLRRDREIRTKLSVQQASLLKESGLMDLVGPPT
jgi:hypothetical protein